MLWLALHFPRLPLEVFAGAAGDATPTAVYEDAGGAETLVACNRVAQAHGIRAGMGVAAARVELPVLRLLPRAPAREGELLARTAMWAGGFSDQVGLFAPAGLGLEVGGSLRLFGGLGAIEAAITEELTALGREARVGIAPTPAAARLLARQGGGRVTTPGELAAALRTWPCTALEIDETVAARLAGWGLHTLGEVLDLPRGDLARRLGPAFVERLDRLRGDRLEPVARFTPPGRFVARVPLPAETRELDLPLQALAGLVRELAGFLRARDAAVQRLRVRLHARAGPGAVLDVGLAVPGRDPRHLLALVRERLERGLPDGPVTSVSLCAPRLLPHEPPAVDLWQGAQRHELPERLLERLRARLGEAAVRGVSLTADHRPERAWHWQAPGQVPPYEPPRPPPRPLWLLPRPAALALDAQRQPRFEGPLELLDGPERIETGWWDGDDVERDYFVARNPGGMTLWVYRERRVPRTWFLHGFFG